MIPEIALGKIGVRVRPRFFDQVGHETMYKHFFTKSCHPRTYQNYEQPPQTSQNLYFFLCQRLVSEKKKSM